MSTARELFHRLTAELARHAFLHELVRSTLLGLAVYTVCALVILAAERSQRSSMSAYRTRNALNDLAYVVFYQCSLYNVLASPLFASIVPRLKFLRAGLLLNLPPFTSLLVCWLIFDFLNYGIHWLQHRVAPLWAFHSVHHAQTQVTFLTANRIHAVEQLYVGLLMIVPAFVLGIPQPRWLPRWAWTAIAIAASVATVDEIHQMFVPSRTASVFDVLLDTGGAALAQTLIRLAQVLLFRS